MVASNKCKVSVGSLARSRNEYRLSLPDTSPRNVEYGELLLSMAYLGTFLRSKPTNTQLCRISSYTNPASMHMRSKSIESPRPVRYVRTLSLFSYGVGRVKTDLCRLAGVGPAGSASGLYLNIFETALTKSMPCTFIR